MKPMILATLFLSAAVPALAETKPVKWQVAALKSVKAEKSVLAARWRMPETNVLWVSVAADGSRRDGFAEYLCMLFDDAGAPADELKTIFIYDPAGYKDGAREIGMAACR